MTLDKLFIMKHSVIIDIIQARLILSERVSFSTNALPIARKTIASLLHKTLNKMYRMFIGAGKPQRPGHSALNSAAF